MIKRIQIAFCLGITIMAGINNSNAQVIFSENFNGGNALSNWTLINNDGNTPAAGVANFTNAWILIEDTIGISDSAAASTSWYTPAGTSDDYLISPSVTLTANNTITWDAKAQDPAYPDGYQLLISTTTPTVAGFTANQPLFSISAENSTWTKRTIDLDAAGYSNQNVYFAWRNNSTDQFILLVDNIVVQKNVNFDVNLVAVQRMSEYAMLPKDQSSNIVFAGLVANSGASSLSNVKLKYSVVSGGSVLYSDSSLVSSLASGADTVLVNMSNYAPTATGTYRVVYEVTHDSVDNVLTNNMLTSDSLMLTDSVFSRAFGPATGSLGIGSGTHGELGTLFELKTADTLTSIDAFIVNNGGNMTNQPLSAVIRSFNNGLPGAVIAHTDTITYTNTAGSFARLPFTNNGGSVILPADSFFVGIVERDSNITLGTTPNKFKANTNFVIFGTNPWRANESYNFTVTYMINANFGKGIVIGVDNITKEATSSLSVSPNPTDGAVKLTYNNLTGDQQVKIKVLDIQGRVVLTSTAFGNNLVSKTIDLSSFEKGIYFIQTISGKEINTKKVILK
ncbi:MAG: T9SS C-terminal target domain-containing protein [Bacteroidetes bacterium]|nr:MAG: T9SS C-terminal target domain-containing protein [Bacteroidota bacterium]MBL1143753.1 T9SS C-terminal target domain-containing protein [Bacteroidota bacterium]MCB0802604.1 choice-of-anchor J domain-containing protein [Flavobacteriales bacterium]NOG56554.1 T9SS type A sorting domain-containing protein [Bacteroidota bacterium]